MASKRLICHDHDAILEDIATISELLDEKLNKTNINKIKRFLKRIEKMTINAKVSGQLMEDRLQEYYEAITKIGFRRER